MEKFKLTVLLGTSMFFLSMGVHAKNGVNACNSIEYLELNAEAFVTVSKVFKLNGSKYNDEAIELTNKGMIEAQKQIEACTAVGNKVGLENAIRNEKKLKGYNATIRIIKLGESGSVDEATALLNENKDNVEFAQKGGFVTLSDLINKERKSQQGKKLKSKCDQLKYSDINIASVMAEKRKGEEGIMKSKVEYMKLYNESCEQAKCIMTRDGIDYKEFRVRIVRAAPTPIAKKMYSEILEELDYKTCSL